MVPLQFLPRFFWQLELQKKKSGVNLLIYSIWSELGDPDYVGGRTAACVALSIECPQSKDSQAFSSDVLGPAPSSWICLSGVRSEEPMNKMGSMNSRKQMCVCHVRQQINKPKLIMTLSMACKWVSMGKGVSHLCSKDWISILIFQSSDCG